MMYENVGGAEAPTPTAGSTPAGLPVRGGKVGVPSAGAEDPRFTPLSPGVGVRPPCGVQLPGPHPNLIPSKEGGEGRW